VNVRCERRVPRARTRPKPSQAADHLNADGIGIGGLESWNPQQPPPRFRLFLAGAHHHRHEAPHCRIRTPITGN